MVVLKSPVGRAVLRWTFRVLWLLSALLTAFMLLTVLDGLTAEECRCFWEEHLASLRQRELRALVPGAAMLVFGGLVLSSGHWIWRVLVAAVLAGQALMIGQIELLLQS